MTLVKKYQTLSCSIGITSLSTAPFFSTWRNIKFDELLSSCSPTTSKIIICCIFIHTFTSFLFPYFSVGLTSSASRPTKKLKMAEEKKATSSSRSKKPNLSEDVRSFSNLRRSSCRLAYQFDFSNTVDDPIEVEEVKDSSKDCEQGSAYGAEL